MCPEISRTTAVMSLEFDACSTTAQEASQRAELLLFGSHDSTLSKREAAVLEGLFEKSGIASHASLRGKDTLYVLTDPEAGSAIPMQCDTYDIGDMTVANPLGDTVELKLIHPRQQQKKHASSGIDMQLVGVTGGKVAVPIAGFAKREGSACSYVQIEGEMEDENFVVTPRDARLSAVRAISALLKNEQTDDTKREFHEMVVKSFLRYQEKIQEELAPSVVRQVFRRFEVPRPPQFDNIRLQTEAHWKPYYKAGHSKVGQVLLPPINIPEDVGTYAVEKTLQFIEGDTSEEGLMLVNYISEGRATLSDGRPVRLAVVKTSPKNGRLNNLLPSVQRTAYSDKAYLAVIARNDVALPIMVFSTNERHIETIFSDDSREIADADIIQGLHNVLTLPTHELIKELEDAALKSLPHQPGRFDQLVIRKSKYASNHSTFELGSFRHPVSVYHYLGNVHTVQDLVIQRLKNYPTHPSVKALLVRFDVAQRFREHLGQYRADEEKLLKQLGFLAAKDKIFTGRINQMPLGGDEIGDVDIAARLSEGDQGYNLWIGGRPTASTDRPHSSIYEVDIHPARKIELEQNDVAEILQLLGALSVHKTAKR